MAWGRITSSNRFTQLYLQSELLHQPALPLMPDGEDVHPILFRQVTIQCDIACPPFGNHQFTQVAKINRGVFEYFSQTIFLGYS